MRLPPGFNLVSLEKVDSTNSEARRRAEMGASAGTIVQALEQTRGRGSRGRQWTSPKGNLYFSIILNPNCSVSKCLEFTFITSVAMCDALAAKVSPMTEVSVKWPNDVLINRRKVSGILLESANNPNGLLKWLIVGIGLNVVSFPKNTEYPATSLEFEGTMDSVRDNTLELFLRHFKRWIDVWENEGFSSIRQEWLSRAIGLGQQVRVKISENQYEGKFIDLGSNGSLILEIAPGETVSVLTGDVFPLDVT